jgi:adenylate cyclase
MIKDLQSSNGIRINDNLIEPNQFYPLKDNDMVLCGPISLLFCAINHAENHQDSTATIGNEYIDLVTILPSERKYEETVTIRAELEAEEEVAFMKSENVEDIETIRGDYEKLRLVYELSKMSVTDDINKLLSKSLDLLFEILPLDRGVILLHDQSTGYLTPHYVKLRQGLKNEKREILLSSTILHKVFYTRKCLHTSDACEDPMLGKAASVRTGQIRSVICVPLIAHNRVYGILHLDSNNRVNPFSNKDLSLVKAIGNQTAMVIENMNLIKEVEAKARITEQLSRFLPPHVVDKMTNRSEIIRGFTNISEKSQPMEVVKLLNDYFEKVRG